MAFKENKPMTESEFRERVMAVNDALKIFGNLTDNNITTSFMAYIEVFNERTHPVTMPSTSFPKGMPHSVVSKPSAFDNVERPVCPECKSNMYIRALPAMAGDVLTQLVCSNQECDTVLNSDKPLEWWLENLPKKGNDKNGH